MAVRRAHYDREAVQPQMHPQFEKEEKDGTKPSNCGKRGIRMRKPGNLRIEHAQRISDLFSGKKASTNQKRAGNPCKKKVTVMVRTVRGSGTLGSGVFRL